MLPFCRIFIHHLLFGCWFWRYGGFILNTLFVHNAFLTLGGVRASAHYVGRWWVCFGSHNLLLRLLWRVFCGLCRLYFRLLGAYCACFAVVLRPFEPGLNVCKGV